jgi:hypothetical protein
MSFTATFSPLRPSSSSSSCPWMTFYNNRLSFKSHPPTPPVTSLEFVFKKKSPHQIKLHDSAKGINMHTSIRMRIVLFSLFPRWIDWYTHIH